MTVAFGIALVLVGILIGYGLAVGFEVNHKRLEAKGSALAGLQYLERRHAPGECEWCDLLRDDEKRRHPSAG